MAARRTGLAALALGLAIAAAAQLTAPLAAPPLYDGVVVTQPYVYVNPPAGQPGGARGASAHLPVTGRSPLVALATPEQPPQAQIVAGDGTLVLPPSATALDASITPLDPTVDATVTGAARVLGNIYRITLVDQAGAAATAPAAGLVTVVLRAPEDVAGAQIGQVVDGTWHPLKSESMFGAAYVAVVTGFGDFAVIVAGSTSASPAASGAALSSFPASAAVGTPSAPVVTGPPAGGTGSGDATGSDGFPSGQLLGALAFLLLLAFIGIGSVVRLRRGTKPPR